MPIDTADGEKQIDVPAFAAAVQRVLADPAYRVAARRVAESMRTYGGAQEAANRIEHFAARFTH
jgi:UDP:flavonoid glycosyltransferase YjiC (YdhE family)